ncbi:MAG: hypothetical protein PGN12_06120 [Sphingomonas phyllosphaerae]
MPHVIAPAPRRHDRARAAAPTFQVQATSYEPRMSPLNAVSLQIIAGLIGPLPFIQLGNLLFGWPSVAVMFGGL